MDSLVTILSKEHPLIIPSISAAVNIENTKNVSQCRNVVLLNGFAIIWNSVEIACGDAVIGNAQGKGEKRKICAQKWMKKKTDGIDNYPSWLSIPRRYFSTMCHNPHMHRDQ